MKFLSIPIILNLLLPCWLWGQLYRLAKPILSDSVSTHPGLASNGVTQIAAQDSIIWLATGGGLSRTDDFGESYTSYKIDSNSMPQGGISAIAVLDSVIWVAGVFDSTTEVGSQQTGGGLAYSKDQGETWTYVPQPVDNKNDDTGSWGSDTSVSFLPVTTPVNNTTWDISVAIQDGDTAVYIASWAGGLRRSVDFGASWQRIPLPSDELDQLGCNEEINFEINPRDPPLGNHNHKGFSVIAHETTVWVGTANGINYGIVQENGCIDWQKYNAQNSNLAGNFIVALARQPWNGTIWAAVLPAEGAGEMRAACKTPDQGRTWYRTLVGKRIYNFAFHDSTVYACTESGLYKSVDGENWAVYHPMADTANLEYIFTHNIYAAHVDILEENGPWLWVGTGDGIAKTASDGLQWSIFRQAAETSQDHPIYAYPNPFAPNHHNYLNGEGHVRIQYTLENPATILLEVYDFAMDPVYRGKRHLVTNTGSNSEVWTGKNSAGRLVANGTYFCKLTIKYNGVEKYYWTKLIVVK